MWWQVCWLTIECRVYHFWPDTSILRQFVSTLPIILQLIQVLSFLIWWSSKQRLETLYSCSVRLFVNSQFRSHATIFAWGFSHPGNFSIAPAEIRDSNISPFSLKKESIHLVWIHIEYIPNIRGEEMILVVGSFRSTFFINFFHMRGMFCFFPDILMSSTYTDREKFFFCKKHFQFGTFSYASSNNTFWNCLSHKRPASGCPYKFLSRGTAESTMLFPNFGFFGFLEDVSNHQDILLTLEFLSNLGDSSNFTWV